LCINSITTGKNQIKGTIPSNLATLRKIKMLWIRKCVMAISICFFQFLIVDVTDNHVILTCSFINGCSYTEENALTGIIPTQLGNLRGLTELNLCKWIMFELKDILIM